MSNPFASQPAAPVAAPAVAPPPTMPDPQSPDVLAAKRKAEQNVMARAGRSSTILTSAADRGNTSLPDFSSNKLGSS